ncbi:4TM region of histidine kinase [Natronorubrum sediminis]|uniref:histidine kinase n=1 Tax=Natronorubrum sediminis TaxID=640943 RepID=A0A1H6FM36_9EURY|nr:ATP-binding protein [Natronorubrum sediminis]SEH11168.1 4TM region of histidine kinase [Natronorubrum sediminis]
MIRWKPIVSLVGPRRLILFFGMMYVVAATGRTIVRLSSGGTPSSVFLTGFLISAFGAVLCYGSYRLPRTSIDDEYHPYVAGWSLAGFAIILSVLVLYHLLAEGGIANPSRAIPILTSIGTTAGYGIGVYDGKARTREHELERRNRALETTQAELEETVARLERSNQQLEASNERLEQFAYAASHDLQEPLRMVSSYLQLIERRNDDLDAETEEFLEYAVDGADRMRRVIDGLLRYSRVETEGAPLEPIDLETVFEDVCDDLSVKIAECDGEVTADDLPHVDGDEGQLRQLLGNLIRNALEYSGEEPPSVHVTAERNGTDWHVSVSDDGIGIVPDDQEQIFEMFHRLHTHEEHEGTGLGLALCERIAERHGGAIQVDSTPGSGSTFTVTLPACPEEA